MRRNSSRLLGFLLAVSSASGVANAEPLVQTIEEHRNDVGEIEKRSADFMHRASGFVFPGALGEMPARKTKTYGPGDAAVYYTYLGGANGDPWIDVYVYPAALEPAAERREVEQALIQNFGAEPAPTPAGLPARPDGAMDGWYRGSLQGSDYLTGYRILLRGDWYIKARITVPAKGGTAAIERAMKGIAAIPWMWEAPSAERNRDGSPAGATPRED